MFCVASAATLSYTIFLTPAHSHNFVTHYLSHTISLTQLCHTPSFSHTTHAIFHTPAHSQLCHTPSFSHHLKSQLCHTPPFSHHLTHTTLSQTIFHTPSFTTRHTPSFAHLSHTTLSPTIFHHTILQPHLSRLCHTQLFHTTLSISCFFRGRLAQNSLDALPSCFGMFWHVLASFGMLWHVFARFGMS